MKIIYGKRWVALLLLALLGLAPAPLQAADDAQVEKSFQEFQKGWIKKLNTEGNYGEKHMRIAKYAETGDAFIASYEVVKEVKSSQIKKTEHKATPYIGTLVYEIWTCSAKGKTPEEAKKGPFSCKPQSETTEIFRYTGSKWVY